MLVLIAAPIWRATRIIMASIATVQLAAFAIFHVELLFKLAL
jgi:hypothetical protein